jgi:hypothetical protein
LPGSCPGTGINALVEYQTGTAPAHALSALRVETVTPAEGSATVNFNAAANRTYTLEWTPDVAGGSWQKLSDVVAQAADHGETVTDPAANEGPRFYRVVTPRRP